MSELPGHDALVEALGRKRGRGRGKPRIRVSAPEQRTEDGIVFDSKAEARHYRELKLKQTAGAVHYFLTQVPIRLPGNVRYVVDFLVFYPDGTHVYEDVKGHRTDVYRVKKRLVEALYPIRIVEVEAR